MTRTEALDQARKAAHQAAYLAGEAERHAYGTHIHKTTALAAAGALWADTSRAYAALAQALPETEA
ncbi:hypothetical protein ABZ669_14580 [Streptomyces hirsutus]|uniref:hypothetical protein n=1 Tax=Streptomyces hirsutus TaxID=35620 RepID=UPI003406CA7F